MNAGIVGSAQPVKPEDLPHEGGSSSSSGSSQQQQQPPPPSRNPLRPGPTRKPNAPPIRYWFTPKSSLNARTRVIRTAEYNSRYTYSGSLKEAFSDDRKDSSSRKCVFLADIRTAIDNFSNLRFQNHTYFFNPKKLQEH